MKECELCEKPARMYCESDQASLCWECDTKVHGANFLVARHTRSLLCRGCQAPTPWRASGARLGQTVSVCDRCTGAEFAGVKRHGSDAERDGAAEEECGEEDNDEDDEDEEEEEEDDDDEEEEEEEEEDGDNQVVPGTMTPPPVASSSSSDESSTRVRGGILKRMRESTDLAPHQDDLDCSSSQPRARSSPDDGATSLRPSKDRKTAALAGDTHHHHLDLRSRRPSSSRPI